MKLKTNNELFKSPKFWIMLCLFLFMAIWDIVSYLYPIIQGMIEVHKINDFIKGHESKLTLDDLINSKNQDWWSYIFKKGDNDSKVTMNNVFVTFTPWVDSDDNTKGILHAEFNAGESIIFNSSYFTVLSNILVTSVFGYVTFKPKNEGIKGLGNSKVMITTAIYITITMLIYCFAIFPLSVMAAKGNPFKGARDEGYLWANNASFHVIIPLIFIIYTICFANIKFDYKNLKQEKKKLFILQVILLLAYGLFTFIRGTIKYLSGSAADDPKAFPYGFTQFYNSNLGSTHMFPGWGFLFFFIFVIIIAAILFGFESLYIIVLRKRTDENYSKKEKITTKKDKVVKVKKEKQQEVENKN